MSNDFLNDNNNEAEENLNQINEVNEEVQDDDSRNNVQTESSKTEKPVLPRKRKIIKNYQLPVTIGIVLVALLTVVVWNLFFDQTITGSWHYIKDGSYTETYDEPTATPDGVASVTTDYSQRVCYEFTQDGECIVTIGTTSIAGQYALYTTEESRILSAYVFNNYTAVMYGNYTYEVKGNIFTGKKLIITDMYSGEAIELEEGEGESPLTPFEKAELDDRFTGKWRDDERGLTYEFTSDGYLTITTDDGMIVEHVYTIVEEGSMLVKYYGNSENSYSFVYSFDDDDNLTFNGYALEKIG